MSKNKRRIELGACENINQSVSSVLEIRDYLEQTEEIQIHRQFRSISWKPDRQVLWSGMLRKQAQTWADERDMQTLTTAMGPLMDTRIPSCLYNHKSPKAWSKYIHGASAVFAWHIAMGDVVTVLCPPPPQRFHPSGLSSFQTIEEPILRSAIADGAELRIELAHPLVKGAEEYRYQFWPEDETNTWVAVYGTTPRQECVWRKVKGESPPAVTKKTVKPQIAASENAEKVDKQPSTIKKAVECQQASSKKAKKKKRKQKKQASCAMIVNLAGATTSTAKSKKGVPNKTTMSIPASANSATPNMITCPGKKTSSSKRERNAPKAREAAANVQETTTRANDDGGRNKTADFARQATRSTAATATPTPRVAKAQRRKAKKARKKAKKEAKKAKKETKKASEALCSTTTPTKKGSTEKQALSKQTCSMMDDAIAAMELQYQLDFRPEIWQPADHTCLL